MTEIYSGDSFSFEVKNRLNPKELAKEIIPQISDATRGYVIGNIKEYSGEIFSYRKKSPLAALSISGEIDVDVQDSLGEKSPKEETYEIYLTAKDIEDYQYRILFFRFGIGGYPVKVVVNEDLAEEINKKSGKYIFTAESMDAFEQLLIKILQTRELKTIMQSIIEASLRGDYNNDSADC